MSGPQRANSDAPAPNASSADDPPLSSPIEGVRPSIARVWQTERPPALTKTTTLPPALARGATNTSALNKALWTRLGDESSSEDSSLSSDEEEEETTTQPTRKSNGYKNAKQKEKGGGYSRFNVGNDDYKTRGRVSKRDGRLNISVNETSNRGYLAKALGATFFSEAAEGKPKISRLSSASTITCDTPRPNLNIVIMVIGSRGDIQPFLKIGKDLQGSLDNCESFTAVYS